MDNLIDKGIMMNEYIGIVTDGDFDAKVLQSDKPVLVDFWAEWCGPCRALTPVFEEVAKALHTNVHFMKINIDENPKMPARYGVMSIPTLILFKNGEIAATKMGLMNKSQLMAFVESNL